MKQKKIENVCYPGPVQHGLGYFRVNVKKSDREVFASNFPVPDNAQVFLQLLDVRPRKRSIEAHNEGEHQTTCTIRPASAFDLLGRSQRKTTIPGRSSQIISLE